MSSTDPLVSVPVRDVAWDGSTILELRTFASVGAKLSHLADLARWGAVRSDPFGVRSIAARLGTVARCHAWVRDAVRYSDEPAEQLESAAWVALHRVGDCDGQAVLVASLVASLGGLVRIVPMGGTPDDPAHVVSAVALLADDRRGVGSRVSVGAWVPFSPAPAPAPWLWAETTVAAELGEAPIAAAHRLGAARADLGRL